MTAKTDFFGNSVQCYSVQFGSRAAPAAKYSFDTGVVQDSRSKPGRCYRLQSCRVQIPEEKKLRCNMHKFPGIPAGNFPGGFAGYFFGVIWACLKF